MCVPCSIPESCFVDVRRSLHRHQMHVLLKFLIFVNCSMLDAGASWPIETVCRLSSLLDSTKACSAVTHIPTILISE